MGPSSLYLPIIVLLFLAMPKHTAAAIPDRKGAPTAFIEDLYTTQGNFSWLEILSRYRKIRSLNWEQFEAYLWKKKGEIVEGPDGDYLVDRQHRAGAITWKFLTSDDPQIRNQKPWMYVETIQYWRKVPKPEFYQKMKDAHLWFPYDGKGRPIADANVTRKLSYYFMKPLEFVDRPNTDDHFRFLLYLLKESELVEKEKVPMWENEISRELRREFDGFEWDPTTEYGWIKAVGKSIPFLEKRGILQVAQHPNYLGDCTRTLDVIADRLVE